MATVLDPAKVFFPLRSALGLPINRKRLAAVLNAFFHPIRAATGKDPSKERSFIPKHVSPEEFGRLEADFRARAHSPIV